MRSALVRRRIDPGSLLDEVQRASNGALVLFVGTVRELNDGRAVTGMSYSAYESMAAGELERIVTAAAVRFGTTDLVVEHRIGDSLAVGDVSVAIAAGHQHRGEAFEAARYVIEELKRKVPIWKLEHYVDGTREWVNPAASKAPAGATEEAR